MTEQEEFPVWRGVGKMWADVNHIAIVVEDVGRSLQFYTDVVGMKQIMRPNFDRHGAWLTFGNVDLHLIKGRPAVHPDDDLIVSHIAITIDDMDGLRSRLEEIGVKSRKNISVPNPEANNSAVDQAFVRDPDGYYIEFCNCAALEEFVHAGPKEKNWNIGQTFSVLGASGVLKKKVEISKNTVLERSNNTEVDFDALNISPSDEADPIRLKNLVDRRKIYGDITQNAKDESELEALMKRFANNVPLVIKFLEERMRKSGKQTLIPPAFYERDGSFFQPPPIEIDLNKFKKQ